MSDHELIKAVVREVFEEERARFWVSPEQHYQDHEFLSSVREGRSMIKKASIATVTAAAASFFIWALIEGVKRKFGM